MQIWNELVQFFQIYNRAKTSVFFSVSEKMSLTNWSSDTGAGIIVHFLNNSWTSVSNKFFLIQRHFCFCRRLLLGLTFLEIEFSDLSRSGEFPCRWSVLTSLIQSWLFCLPEVYFLGGVKNFFLIGFSQSKLVINSGKCVAGRFFIRLQESLR